MNRQKITIVVFSFIVAIMAFTYGALTAPGTNQADNRVQVTTPPEAKPDLSDAELSKLLQSEEPAILTVINQKYPNLAAQYSVNKGRLYGDGTWYGTTLNYQGQDTMNRDTLRVLVQKVSGAWIVRTTPPEIILSKAKYPDVPIEILKTINLPISLPGNDTPDSQVLTVQTPDTISGE